MPLPIPTLDDRSFDDLVEELIARIPAHTPEWTNPRTGDPGRTLIDLFAWLGDTLLYRANLIPERQRLAFLRLLGITMQPAIAAQGLISVQLDDSNRPPQALSLRPYATVKGAVTFETTQELTVFPITAEAFYKRKLETAEREQMHDLLLGLQQIYGLEELPNPYVTSRVFPAGSAQRDGFDLIKQTVDGCLWLALLAAKPDQVEAVRTILGSGDNGGRSLLNVGVAPAIAVPALFEDIGARAHIPHNWQISTGREIAGQPEYLNLNVVEDGTAGLTRYGIVRLALPNKDFIGAPGNDVRQMTTAGTGDRPPRIDQVDIAQRLVTWVRLCPRGTVHNLSLSWVGVNAALVDQRQTVTGRVIGESDGSANQVFTLPGQSVEAITLAIEVEELGRGYQAWQPIDDLTLAGTDDAVYQLDSEAGTIQFGDDMRGRIPPGRIRVARMRSGGGQAGNLPPGSLADMQAVTLQGVPVTTRLKVLQPLATTGGDDAETLEAAERRIPQLLRHRDRAVTVDDYRALAASTPGVRLGRVELMPRFKPHQRRSNVPGVVSVMVLPFKAMPNDTPEPPNPRPDRPLLEAVHAYLDARRPLTTELYVIGCEYVPLGISVGVDVQIGFAINTVLLAVRQSLFRFLWSLSPGGAMGTGWELGKSVSERELEVIISRVPGVRGVLGIRLFKQRLDQTWEALFPPALNLPVEVRLQPWQLPELLAAVVVDGEPPLNELTVRPQAGQSGIAVPVVPEVC